MRCGGGPPAAVPSVARRRFNQDGGLLQQALLPATQPRAHNATPSPPHKACNRNATQVRTSARQPWWGGVAKKLIGARL